MAAEEAPLLRELLALQPRVTEEVEAVPPALLPMMMPLLQRTVDALQRRVSKAGLIGSQGGLTAAWPTLQEEALNGLKQLFAAYQATAAAGCLAMRTELSQWASQLFAAYKQFTVAAADESKHGALAPLAGAVWEACDELKKLPSCNRAAVILHMKKLVEALGDTCKEFSAMQAEAEEAAAAAAAAGDGDGKVEEAGESKEEATAAGFDADDDLFMMDDDDDEPLSSEDCKRLPAVISMFGQLRRLVRATAFGLLKLPKDDALPMELVPWLDSVASAAQELYDAAVAAGMALYPPFTVEAAAPALRRVCEKAEWRRIWVDERPEAIVMPERARLAETMDEWDAAIAALLAHVESGWAVDGEAVGE
eukprot:PLAT3861.4.p1 GENE.PLAT3861.4~~PLAT3861.4.p1  ORF type:complete len:365 (-),score=159.66 PLAT3861.4:1587-2681(-)